MNLKVIGDRVLVEKIKEEEKKLPSGLIMPDTVSKMPKLRVIKIGTGINVSNTGLLPGDYIHIKKWSGVDIPIEGTKGSCMIVEFEDIVAMEKEE